MRRTRTARCVLRYTNNAAGDLVALVDGKNQVTKWNYDDYGRVTNKVDQVSAEILRYKYDPDSRLTNRWSAAKGDTKYKYDGVGNLTNIDYAASTDVTLQYDPMNRVTNMVDAAGTTVYNYTIAGRLFTEDGPWASDTVTNFYNNGLRTNLVLAQPTGKWTNGFAYDTARRLTSVTSPAGAFTYTLAAAGPASPLIQKLLLPNTSYITNAYDNVARLRFTKLNNSSHTTLDSALYGYNAGNQRVTFTNTAGTWFTNTYDSIGQLKIADSSTASEDRRYVYDAAWNLNFRTNNTALYTFKVDTKNQLTNATGMTSRTHDDNGNVTFGKTSSHSAEGFSYDDENRLQNWYWYDDDVNGGGSPTSSADLRTEFVYDGQGRLRNRVEYTSDGAVWVVSAETRYIYDGMRVIQERDTNNTPTVSYTRGTDLSGSLEGAGGIGGLLGRSHAYQTASGSWTNHNFYHADGNGNITYLVNSAQTLAASYRYDPFGNTTTSSGILASANVYRFSSKEVHVNSGLYYYGYRFYSPSLQRWLNRDPLGEGDGPNLFAYVRNRSMNFIDIDGRQGWGAPFFPPPKPPSEGASDCASRIAHEVGRQVPFGARDPSSRWNHCVASCRISRECSGGRFTAWIAGDWYQDPWWLSEKYSNSDPGDRAANQVGRDASCNK
ncbi:MAG: RHS repeat-associated core domain-containing protein [Verrucomicrobia bacterium]|nr:RHS repeat-associated core domain-containing protein [Verrucomicrobiota bacterium]